MIYFMLHGFASATPNETSAFFENAVLEDGDRLVNLNYRFNEFAADDLEQEVSMLLMTDEDIEMGEELTFVGCSLGGYMAQYCAYVFNGKAIAINPAVIPAESLLRFLGENTNYKTLEEFDLTEKDVESFARFQVKPGLVPTLVLLDMADDVLDSAKTVSHFASKAAIRTFPGGSHRFEHLSESLEDIREFARTIV